MIYLLVSIFIFNSIVFFMPKRLTWVEMLTTSLFAESFQQMVDIFLDLKYDLYGYFNKGVDYQTVLVIAGVFPAVNIIFLNYFPYGKRLKNKGFYIVVWTVFLVLYERGALQSGYFYYNGWKTWYSVLCYPIILSILALELKLLRKVIGSQYSIIKENDPTNESAEILKGKSFLSRLFHLRQRAR